MSDHDMSPRDDASPYGSVAGSKNAAALLAYAINVGLRQARRWGMTLSWDESRDLGSAIMLEALECDPCGTSIDTIKLVTKQTTSRFLNALSIVPLSRFGIKAFQRGHFTAAAAEVAMRTHKTTIRPALCREWDRVDVDFEGALDLLRAKWGAKPEPTRRKSRRPPQGRPDYTGVRFNRLVGVRFVKTDKNSKRVWEWRCDCGKTVVCAATLVTRFHNKSCGCFSRDRARMMGLTGLPAAASSRAAAKRREERVECYT